MKEISAEHFALFTILFILTSDNFQLTKCAENIKEVFRSNSSLNEKYSCTEGENCALV
jgi:hypothetical protein